MRGHLPEKLAWVIGGLVLVGALFVEPAGRPADPGLWMASLSYLLGLHWIVAYCFGRPMYGALRLLPSQRVTRTVIFAAGILLMALALRFLFGFGGPFASDWQWRAGLTT